MRLALFLPALALLASPSTEPLAWAPEAGTRLERRIEHRNLTAMDDFRVEMGGQEVPSEYLPQMEFEIRSSGVLAVTDELVAVGPGRPEVLLRRYDEIEAEASESFSMTGMDPSEESGSAGSALVGEEVRFAWSDDEDGFVASSPSGAEELPDGLGEDLGLRALLPTESVAVGDAWELDGALFTGLHRPGGDLGLVWSRSEGMRGDYDEVTDLGGTLDATLVSVEEGVARIEITGELEGVEEETSDLEEVPMVDGTAKVVTTTTYDVEAVLLWDVEHGHLASFELSADALLEMETTKDEGQPGPTYVSLMSFSGAWELTVEVERL